MGLGVETVVPDVKPIYAVARPRATRRPVPSTPAAARTRPRSAVERPPTPGSAQILKTYANQTKKWPNGDFLGIFTQA